VSKHGVLVLLATAAVLLVLTEPAGALTRGPWKLIADERASGRSPSVVANARWTYSDEYGPSSGVVEKAPIPKKMAFVVTGTPGNRFSVVWHALCDQNGERPAQTHGTASGAGKLTIYPKLDPRRVECDPFVVAHMAGTGRIAVRIYAY
jgi:hypothetical protein